MELISVSWKSFKWLLRHRTNKVDIDWVQKGLNVELSGIGWAPGNPTGPLTLRGPKQICHIFFSVEKP